MARRNPATQRQAVISACMRADGTAALALSSIPITKDEVENGLQFYLAEGHLLFVHFEEDDLPPCLQGMLRRCLGVDPGPRAAFTSMLKEII